MSHTILAVNPGSTTTKLALFRDEQVVWDTVLEHPRQELAATVWDQLDYRLEKVMEALPEDHPEPDMVVGRGGLLRPIPGGLYGINQAMLEDLAQARFGEHPCNLGAAMARELAGRWNAGTCIVDPVVTDEMDDHARVTGLPGVERRSVFHALSQRGAAREAARMLDIPYENAWLLVLHMGGGVSMGAHKEGRVVDVINALDGEGPMSPERTGSLPVLPAIDYYETHGLDFQAMRRTVQREGGLWAHLGTNDLRRAEEMARQGDEKASLVLDAMAYQIAKCACSLLPALSCQPDGIVITGGMARSGQLVSILEAYLGPVATVVVIAGMEEMEAMARGALRGLRGEEAFKEY